jgi:hypothetical protein
MTFWTILWVTALGGLYDGQSAFLVYPSLEACEAALNPVGDTLPYDHRLLCEETPVMSSSLRPKRRPEGLGL